MYYITIIYTNIIYYAAYFWRPNPADDIDFCGRRSTPQFSSKPSDGQTLMNQFF